MNPLIVTLRAWPRTTVWLLLTIALGLLAMITEVYQ